jgi:phage portal protein BeeE
MIKQKIKGAENANNIVATNGIVEYKQIGLSPVDLAILDSLNYDRDTICRIFGVDPILFSTDSASYNNKEQASKKLVSDVMVHYLNLYRDFWNEIAAEYSVNGKTYYIDYDLSALPEIQAEYVALISSLKEAYWVTPNEKRIATNFDSDENPNMDKYYFPSNLVALDELTALVDTNIKNYGDYR